MKYTFCDKRRKNQCVDKNGNNELDDDNVNNNFYNQSEDTESIAKNSDDDKLESKNRIDLNAINKLHAIAISDDEDYGESH